MTVLLVGFGKAALAHYRAASTTDYPVSAVLVRNAERYRSQYPHLPVDFVDSDSCNFSEFHAFVLAAPTQANNEMLLNIPKSACTLIEKPGLIEGELPLRENLYVAYNRRFYRLTSLLHSTIMMHKTGHISIVWPEKTNSTDDRAVGDRLTQNTVHVFDMLLYLGASLNTSKIEMARIGRGQRVALEMEIDSSWTIDLQILIDIPAISSLDAYTDDLIISASPLEQTSVWSGVQPTDQDGTRPSFIVQKTILETFQEDTANKPGFSEQYIDFTKMIYDSSFDRSQSVATRMCTPQQANTVFAFAKDVADQVS